MLATEGIAIARSQPVPTGVVAAVAAAVCMAILLTVGQLAAAEERVMSAIDREGARVIVVSDPTGQAQLHADSVESIASLDGVEWVAGIGPAFDVRNGALGAAARPVPARIIYGQGSIAKLVEGRPPRPGEAIVGRSALAELGANVPALGIVGGALESSVVGVFEAVEPLSILERGALIMAPPGGPHTGQLVRSVYVEVATVDSIDELLAAIRVVIHAESSHRVVIAEPALLVELRAVIGGELARNSRILSFATVGTGLAVIAITLVGAVSLRRRDFGRRRVLGATRSMVVGLVLAHAAVGAGIGICLGGIAGGAAVWAITGALPPLSFIAGVSALVLASALVGGLAPAAVAAHADPARILRVP